MSKQLEQEIKDRLATKRLDKLNISLGAACISNGHGFSIDSGDDIFVKTNSSINASVMFNGEFEGLKHINATKTIKAPKQLSVIHNYDGKNSSAIIMELVRMSPLTSESARKLGKSLANLHEYNEKLLRYGERASKWVGRVPPSVKHLVKGTDGNDSEQDSEEQEITFTKHALKVKRDTDKNTTEASSSYPERFIPQPSTEIVEEFGFDVPTSCGAIPQVNQWTKDWVSFYARNRLDVTIRSLLSDHSDRELSELWSKLQLKVDHFFADFEYKASRKGEIIPCLLHGDLWSGNAAQLEDGSDGVVYDPASFYGHNEYEFGIVRMFGGFPPEFEKAYFEVVPKKKNFEQRNRLYQLFHHLNHWNHFGSGYRPSSLKILRDLTLSAR